MSSVTMPIDASGVVPISYTPPPAAPATMFDVEQSLATLADCTELVTPEQEAEFLRDFALALKSAVAKRDRVHYFILDQEKEAALAATEITRLQAEVARLQKRKAHFERNVERMEQYVTGVIKSLDPDEKGAYQKLPGTIVTFSLKRQPPSVAIQDEAAVPARCKSITVTMPAKVWEDLCDSLDLEVRAHLLDSVSKPNCSVNKTLVKEAIAEQVPDYLAKLKEQPAVYCESVPGATITAGGTKLVRA
jgi:hypothetical protein